MKRDQVISVRCSNAEVERLRAAAAASGRSLSRHVVWCALESIDSDPAPADPDATNRAAWAAAGGEHLSRHHKRGYIMPDGHTPKEGEG